MVDDDHQLAFESPLSHSTNKITKCSTCFSASLLNHSIHVSEKCHVMNERPLKDTELKLLSELMKNSRRSDRELARASGISQPTVGRVVKKLQKEGYIKEFTIIPDFKKLGYSIMAITLVKRREPTARESFKEIREVAARIEKENPYASLMAVNVTGKHDAIFIAFYENYEAYSKAMQLTRALPHIEVETVESYLVDLSDETHYRLLSMSEIADHLVKNKKEK